MLQRILVSLKKEKKTEGRESPLKEDHLSFLICEPGLQSVQVKANL